MDQVGDLGMPQLVRRDLKVEGVHDAAVMPCLLSQLRMDGTFGPLPVLIVIIAPFLCSPGDDERPEPLKLCVGQRVPVPVRDDIV